MPNLGKSDLARSYRKKHGDKMPTLKLARILYEENKLAFKDVEDARARLRYIEGKIGKHHIKFVSKTEFYKEEDRSKNPYNLPESDETNYEPYVLSGYKKVALFYDVHAPYHNSNAITLALGHCKKEKVDLLITAGDFWDFHGLSKFLKDPSKKKVGEELMVGIRLLEAIQKALKCKIIFLFGNHDERLEKFVWQKWGEIPELKDLIDIEEVTLESIIRKKCEKHGIKLDIEFVKDKRIIRANELNIIHGHEFGTSVFSPVNIARGLYLRAKGNTICGHHHRTSEHTEKNIENKIVKTWSVGMLCESHPQYLPINNWNTGFAIVELFEDGKTFNVHNKSIYKDKVI